MGEGVLPDRTGIGIVFAPALDTSVPKRSTTSPILILLAVGQLDRAVDAAAVDAGAVEAEVAHVPAAVLEVDLGVQPGGEFVAQHDRVVAAPAESDRLAGREFQSRRQAFAGFQGDSCSHIPTSSRRSRQ